MTLSQILKLAAETTSETATVDFKGAFDATQRGDWCELIKDIVAMANSGGGCIALGVSDDGTRSTWDATGFTNLDPAQMGDQLRKYVEDMEDNVDICSLTRGTGVVPAVAIKAAALPRVFTNPGNYEKTNGKSTQAFPKGGLYFRHGAKSEPAEQSDLTKSMERAIASVRETWLGNIRQVMEAPAGARFQMVTSEVRATTSPTATAIRVVNDPDAPAFRVINPDETHPYRQKELLAEVNSRMVSTKITSYQVWCVRQSLDGDRSHPEFFHEPKFGSKQYSPAFADFIVNEFEKDPEFFSKARSAAKSIKP